MSQYRTFKTTERALAKRLNGQRTGHLGGADVQTDWLSCEVKHRATLPAWLVDVVAQAKRNGGISQLSIAVLHQMGQRHDGDLVVMTLADFQSWFGAGENPALGCVADAENRAALGDAEAAAWLDVCAPDAAAFLEALGDADEDAAEFAALLGDADADAAAFLETLEGLGWKGEKPEPTG